MQPKPQSRDAFELFQSHFDQLLNPRHELIQLARKIDWGRFETAYAGLETEICEHAGSANRAQKMRVLKALDEPALNKRRQFIGPLRAGEISDGLRIGAHDDPIRVGGESRVRQKNGELATAGARVALRVNPDIDSGTHPHISTGLHVNKFGVPLEQARTIYRKMVNQPGLQPVGIHVHLGSQIVTLDPLQKATSMVVKLAPSGRFAPVPHAHSQSASVTTRGGPSGGLVGLYALDLNGTPLGWFLGLGTSAADGSFAVTGTVALALQGSTLDVIAFAVGFQGNVVDSPVTAIAIQ
jgi:hypothetical protein